MWNRRIDARVLLGARSGIPDGKWCVPHTASDAGNRHRLPVATARLVDDSAPLRSGAAIDEFTDSTSSAATIGHRKHTSKAVAAAIAVGRARVAVAHGFARVQKDGGE
jgi:hypothetical protein